MATEKKSWVKDLLVAFAATTLSIILTFGTTAVVNRVKQKQERKLTALMVMSSIEQFARDLELLEEQLAYKDSIATWLLSLPVEKVAKMNYGPIDDALVVVYDLPIITHDKTAETIFSSHIDTWKNMGNFQFIDHVGWCFSTMNTIEEMYNAAISGIVEAKNNIISHPSDYPGNTNIERILRNETVRSYFKSLHFYRGELGLYAANIRMENRNNMRLIGIPEKEVMAFTDDMGAADEYEEEVLNQLDFVKPDIEIDSVAVHLSFARQLDSLLREK
jgi:hypothetical protein